MREARIGRVVAASVHQGVADVLPSRLGFYEDWLKPMALRHGTVGAAAFSAVLSFLRKEGVDYDVVMSAAGRYAADWTFVGSSSVGRGVACRLPRGMRRRVALRRTRSLIVSTLVGGPTVVSATLGKAGLTIAHSPFGVVRERAAAPLCGFYVAAGTRFLELFGVDAHLVETACTGTGGVGECVLSVEAGVGPTAEGVK